MAGRPGVGIVVTRDADGGTSPNSYMPRVTVDLRVFWPPLATDQQIREALDAAVFEVWQEIVDRRGG